MLKYWILLIISSCAQNAHFNDYKCTQKQNERHFEACEQVRLIQQANDSYYLK